MPRAPRLQDAGLLHHIICNGNEGRDLFQSKSDYQFYLKLLNEARRLYPLHIYNYVLMPNFLHLLVEPKQEGSLSKFMEHVSKSYARYYNRKYKTKGHVFIGRFKSFIVQEEKYFFFCSRYIDLIPVKFSAVTEPKDYEWSAYGGLTGVRPLKLEVDIHYLYRDLGQSLQERQIGYRVLVLSSQADDIDLMNRRAGILGDREFKRQIRHN